VHWWIAKENAIQFQAQLEGSARHNRRPMIEKLFEQELASPLALPKVLPRF
jgi:hypothetical protein